jgi:hypothetical protein
MRQSLSEGYDDAYDNLEDLVLRKYFAESNSYVP